MPQASCCFLLFLYFRKVIQEIFSERAQNSRRLIFTRNEDEVRRRARGEPWGSQVGARRGPTLGRTWGALVAPGTPSHHLFAYKLPLTLKSSGTEKNSNGYRGSLTSKVQSRASGVLFRHPVGGGNRHRRPLHHHDCLRTYA